MRANLPQVVIDTNIVASAIRSAKGPSYRLIDLIGKGFFETNLSVALFCEYEDVIKRPEHATNLTETEANDLLDYIIGNSNLRDIYFLWRPLLRDPNDDFVLELSIASGSKYIVTYNVKDFVGCESFGIVALKPLEFLKLIGKANE